MTQITAAMIKNLRDRTGIGMAKCKEALETAGGDEELAIANLRKAGMTAAVKKEGRATNEGMIGSAESEKQLALVEVNAETDFVVRNDRFQTFLKDIAEEAAKAFPGTLENFLSQKYSRDPQLTVDQYRSTIVQAIGENIQIRRVETLSKKKDASIGVYSHLGGKILTVVEIEGSSDVSDLAKDIAMHVAAASPEYLSPEEVPGGVLDQEKEIAKSQVKGKPAPIIDKIVEGKINAFFDTSCLIRQKFIKDDSVTIAQIVEKKAKETGKPLKVVRFLRWAVGA